MNKIKTDETKPRTSTQRWRVVDIIVAAVLGVSVGLIFSAWNSVGYLWFKAMDAFTPGLGGLANGIWLIGGPLGGLIIRKPGAALFVELVGATVSALLGNIWGPETLLSGLVQGLGAEIIFAIFLYRRFNLWTAGLAGAAAGLGAWTGELFYSGNLALSAPFLITYLICCIISGIIGAGILSWALARGLAATGVLNRFASGRSE